MSNVHRRKSKLRRKHPSRTKPVTPITRKLKSPQNMLQASNKTKLVTHITQR